MCDFSSNSRSLEDQLDQPIKIDIAAAKITQISDALSKFKIIPDLPRRLKEPLRSKYMPSISSHYLATIPFDSQIIPNSYLSAKLPIHAQYSTILESIYYNPVTIISAETGAGKTTQIPQFILSSYLANKAVMTPPSINYIHFLLIIDIIVTQPRKIAATSVAERVAIERGEEIGMNSAIGHAVRYDEVKPTNTQDGTASIRIRMIII